MFEGMVTLRRWVDGDTLDFDGLKVGYFPHGGQFVSGRCRPLGYDSPERGQPGYLEAKQAAEALAPLGSQVELRRTHGLDFNGRLLSEVYLSDGRSLTAALVPHEAVKRVSKAAQIEELRMEA